MVIDMIDKIRNSEYIGDVCWAMSISFFMCILAAIGGSIDNDPIGMVALFYSFVIFTVVIYNIRKIYKDTRDLT